MIELHPGSKFGSRYEIVRPLSSGGYAAVYLARSIENPAQTYALKVLFIGQVSSPEIKERFKNELIITAKLHHPNIIRAFDYYEDAEIQAYIMEYVPNGDLSERLTGVPIKPIQVAEVMRQVAAGLEAVHAHGVVHRDLKPENILITSDGVAKLSDFGLARLRGGITLTQSGAMVGTAKFISPEYAETGECDHRADIYALGVIGYEMVSGVSPLGSDLKLSAVLERLKQPAPPLSSVAPHCPPELAQIIHKAMHFEISKRYQSSAELRHDLERVVALLSSQSSGAHGAAGSAKRTGTHLGVGETSAESKAKFSELQKSGTTKRRAHFTRFLIAGLVVIFVAITIVAKAVLHQQAPQARSLSELPRGLYSGYLRSLFGNDSYNSFNLWRTEFGTYALIGKEGCGPTPVSKENRFSCGGFDFEIEIKRAAALKAAGSIKELGWGITGVWSLEKAQ